VNLSLCLHDSVVFSLLSCTDVNHVLIIKNFFSLKSSFIYCNRFIDQLGKYWVGFREVDFPAGPVLLELHYNRN